MSQLQGYTLVSTVLERNIYTRLMPIYTTAHSHAIIRVNETGSAKGWCCVTVTYKSAMSISTGQPDKITAQDHIGQ